MPYVHIRLTPEGLTRKARKTIVSEVTQTLVRVLGKKPEQTHIVIQEINPDDWGFAGMLTSDWRRLHEKPGASPGGTGAA